jgi:D-alanine-D-alanine ligase
MKYNGSNSKASEDCFDKIIATKLCRENKIWTPYPSFQLMEQEHYIEFESFIDRPFGYPLIVKPSRQGSSVGITIFHTRPEDPYTRLKREVAAGPGRTESELVRLLGPKEDPVWDAIKKAVECNEDKNENNAAIVERYIPGKEITVSILGDKALPVIEIRPHSNVYDYKSKYTAGETDYVCPAQLDESLSKEIQNTALKVHKLLGCEVYSRVDFRLDDESQFSNNNFYFLEINTLPGMTETSLFPMAAKAVGLSFEDLIDKIIKLSLEK